MGSILLLIIALVSHLDAANILAVFPIPSISHQVVFRALTQELAKHGHHVTIVTTDPAFPRGQTPENITEIDVHDVSYEIWDEFVQFSTGKNDALINQVAASMSVMRKVFNKQLEHEEFQHLIKYRRNEFDLLLIEACVRTPVALTHVFNVPAIQVSSLGDWIYSHHIIGSPIHPILYGTSTNKRIFNQTWYEKLQEVYRFLHVEYLASMTENEDHKMLRKHLGQDLPGFRELRDNVHMLFLNMHPIWELNRPVPPTVIYMGGIHQIPQKELPQNLKTYLDGSKRGVIYMSFGTNTKPSLLPPEKVKIFLKVFSELPYDILWKWDTDNLPGKPPNARIEKWLPQSDLLRHPKVKLFIMQGGLQSTDEALTAGVPMIAIPMLGDQWYNGDVYMKHGIGIKLDFEIITEDIFRNALNHILDNDSYRQNIVKLRELLNDEPQKPLERAVWWTEYVIRHKGAKHLRAPAANMPWHEYYEIQLLTALFTALLVFATLLGIALKYALSMLRKYVYVIIRKNGVKHTKLKLKEN